MWPQERPVSMPVVRVLSGSLSSQCRILRPRLESRPKPEVSSPVLTWILVFPANLHRGVRPRLEWRHARPLSSRAVATVSGFLRVDTGICGFPQGAMGMSHVPQWCELILRVTVQAVPGNLIHLGWTETFGDILDWWHEPWSSSRLSCGERFHFRWDRKAGNPFLMSQ